MNKLGKDSKVKKSLLRNYENKVRQSVPKQVIHEVTCLTDRLLEEIPPNNSDLGQPSLCSSEILANYLTDVKKIQPQTVTSHDNIDKGQLSSKITRKLNFHFNNKIYRNLIELNANIDEVKGKKIKKPSSSTTSVRKDLEPNIEDFYEDEKEIDSPPNILIPKLKFKPIRNIENGELHSLVAQLEDL